MNGKRYPFLLWDVDDTLLDFGYSERISITRCLEKIGVMASEEMVERYSRINDGWWKRLELGEVTKDQVLRGRFTDLFAEYGIICEDVEQFRRDYQQSLGQVFRCREDSVSLCHKLKNQGYHQFVVTNGVTSVQQSKLHLSGLDTAMEELFISEQIGTPKPGKEFFEVCFNRIRMNYPEFERSKALIIGDSLSSDMKGGRNAGIDTCWYQPAGEITAQQAQVTYTIRSLWDIVQIV